MSHCATISLGRVGGISGGFERVITGISTVARRVGGMELSFDKRSGMDATMSRAGGMVCRMGVVCSTNLGGGILWVQDGKLLNVNGEVIYVTVR